MKPVPGVERILTDPSINPIDGTVRWAPTKSVWIGTMTVATLGLGPMLFSWSAFGVFMAGCAITLCAGHSVGMHRRLIHSSFACPLWLEHICVYLGTLVGMAGPIGMIRIHDMRDWAQRQPQCHDYFSHRRRLLQDAWWQLHCEICLSHPPGFCLEPRVASDRFYIFLERTWMWQHLPWAALFYAIGGPGWVIWGVCARVSVCVTGHWLVGHFAHRKGGQTWIVQGAGVQGYNIAIAGLVSRSGNLRLPFSAIPLPCMS
jgi:stearoyl-CoA desaturase (delta-9 desaturase)